ncbi:DEKNAAC102173 [Brettanomyces naardenensis]|uniref:DEKNAAC102173 n=1 Tax=Brettanomyces naardenensis TaxID=13370 RepID=A0A448YK30_BRENA|nr:DEKNAAC102173 [Brettanomyces naardenensis]
MSDSDDELMALAGIDSEEGSPRDEDDEYEPEINTTRRAGKRHIDEDEEDDLDEVEGEEDPYPLEGKFKDEEDREKLLGMDEVGREQILYDRMQEKERLRERRYLALRARQTKAESSAMQQTGSQSKRLRTSKLSELKRQREQKSRKKSRNDDDEGDLDELIGDDEDDRDLDELAGYDNDDDKAYYSDEYEPRAGRKGKAGKSTTSWGGYDDKYQQDATLNDLNKKVRSSRSVLDRFLYRDEFDSTVPGSYVRVNLGLSRETGRPEYRIARIEEVKRQGKPYKLHGKPCSTYILVSQGDSKKVLDIACISDSPFTEEEFEIYKKRLDNSGLALPSLGEVESRFNELKAMSAKKLTDKDINRMVARKQELVGSMDSASRVRRLAGLREELQAALERVDMDRVQDLTKQIEELTKLKEKTGASTKMSKINLRNKKSTELLIRKAERGNVDLAREHSVVSEDSNNPFSLLLVADVKEENEEEAAEAKENVVNSRYRREGIESVIKDIPIEIELKI